ncbi:MAG: hypothetical protein JWO05_3531 [Gemmatimonadetes bacterium]|nr:hypothetical protein [Gemmatimonadota bacterium]
MRRTLRPCLFILAALVLAPCLASAQGLDLTVNHVGIAIGEVPEVTGLRLNFRDRNLKKVNGINLTLWNPYQPATGVVNGLALGVPITGAREVNGIGFGVLGLGVDDRFRGIGVAGIGMGGGGDLEGILVGGIGLGSGGSVKGIGIGGIGVGSGGNVTGLMLSGVGVGAGGSAKGILVGGIGVGAGGDVRGLAVGGVGVGAGGSFHGIGIGGVGVGAGGDATGLMIGGVGVGVGGRLTGIGLAVLGVGSPEIVGGTLSLAAGAQHYHGIAIAPAWFKVVNDRGREGRFEGASVSAFNQVVGSQHGLTIGIVNYAHSLNGVQFGLVNIVDRPGHRRVMPVINVGHDSNDNSNSEHE